MMAARLVALAGALAMGAPSWSSAGAARILWVELCGAVHSGVPIPVPLHPDENDTPGKACHAACSAAADRRLRTSLPEREGDPWLEE